MEKFIKKHPALYWVLVVVTAVAVFALVTLKGCAKLEMAHASEMSIEHEYLYASEAYSRAEQWIASNLQDGQHYVIFAVDQNTDNPITNGQYQVGCIISNSATVSFSNNNGMYNLSANYWFNVNGSTIKTSSNSYIQVGRGFNASAIYTLEGDISLVGLFPSATNVMVYEKPISVLYSVDAPYTNFQRVTLNYGYEAEDLDDFYADWMTANEWKYYGHLNNMCADDLSYNVEPVFLVQLPTVDYLTSLFSTQGLDLAVDGGSSAFGMYKFYKCLPELMRTWYNDKDAPYVEYEFECAFDLEPDANGNFTYGFTFLELEYLLMAFNSDLSAEFGGYSTDFRAIYMTFAHIECVTSAVETTREDVILYGKVTSNQFRRGIYDACIEVIPEIDINTATPEEIDKILSDATQNAHDEYIKDLEERVEQLEMEMNNATGSLGSFDSEFSGNGLWSAIKGLGNGLLNMTGFLSAVAGIMGGLFGFLPYDVQQLVGYFLIISLLIALWKLIKG